MAATKFDSVSPILAVHDLTQALGFHCGALGFDLAWSWGSPPEIAAVCRDQVEITLTQRAEARAMERSQIYLASPGSTITTRGWRAPVWGSSCRSTTVPMACVSGR